MKNIADIVTVFRLFNSAIEDLGSMFLHNTGACLPEYMQCSRKFHDKGVFLNWYVLEFLIVSFIIYTWYFRIWLCLSSSERNVKPNLLDTSEWANNFVIIYH